MANENSKVPSQVFRWFEKMKANYERNVMSILDKFEKNTSVQSDRVDVAHQAHIDSLTAGYEQQLLDKNNSIEHLKNEINDYKALLNQQQSTIEQLNSRYDTVMHSLLSNQNSQANIKDVFDNHTTSSEHNQSKEQPSQLNLQQDHKPTDDYNNANLHRDNGEFEAAFALYQQAALSGDVKSMGALARCYFLNEGVEENPTQGLAWLIIASDLDYQPALKKVAHYQTNSPELFDQALEVARLLKG